MNLKRITIIIILIIAVLLGVYLFVPINNSKGEDISYKPNNKIEATDNKETIQTIEFLKSISGLKAKNIELIEDFSKEELGFAIGREEVKILAITDKNMAEKLMFLYRENSGTN